MGNMILFKTGKILQKKLSIFWKNLRQNVVIFCDKNHVLFWEHFCTIGEMTFSKTT